MRTSVHCVTAVRWLSCRLVNLVNGSSVPVCKLTPGSGAFYGRVEVPCGRSLVAYPVHAH